MNTKLSLIALFALLALVSIGAATNGRQMKGYFYSPLPGYVNFDITEMEGIGGCIYLGAAGGSAQAGGLYMRVAECNDTSLTALVADGCGSFGQTFPISNTSYTTGEELSGDMSVSQRFNGVAYTEYHVTCYDPTPSQILAPIPGAVPPHAPTPAPIHSVSDIPSLNPNAASVATPALLAILAFICVVASLL